MKRLLLVVLFTSLFAACGAKDGSSGSANGNAPGNSANTATDKPAAKPLAVGDTVVAPWASNSFYEGKVQSIDGTRAKIAWVDNSSPSDVDTIDAYALPKSGDPVTAKAGDYVLAKQGTGSRWDGAKVDSVSPGLVVVKFYSDGSSANLPPEKVIAVSAAVAADLKAEAAKADFLHKAQAGKPVAPSGYKPKAGDKVVSPWTSTSWYVAKVKSVAGDKATLAWEGGMTPEEVSFDKIMPYPTAENTTAPAVGDYLLLNPGNNSSWDYAQAQSVNGTSVEAKLPDGKTRTVKPGEYLVLK